MAGGRESEAPPAASVIAAAAAAVAATPAAAAALASAAPPQAAPVPATEASPGGAPTCPYIGLSRRDSLLPPMRLWDSCMASAIVQQLSAHPGRTVVHVCGSFHVEFGFGVGEMLRHYRRGTHTLTVAIYPADDCHTFDAAEHAGAADFVILTDASLPRSHAYAQANGRGT